MDQKKFIDENGNFIYSYDDKELFKKIVLSALLEKYKTTFDTITEEEYKNFKEEGIMTQNIIVSREIMNKKNYEFLKYL